VVEVAVGDDDGAHPLAGDGGQQSRQVRIVRRTRVDYRDLA
jgi:hypothetical protein